MQLNKQNHIAWSGVTAAQHVTLRDAQAKMGFRTVALALHGSPQQPEYTAAMVRFPSVPAAQSTLAQGFAQFQQTFKDMAAKDMGPVLITATGPANAAVFAGVFRPMKPIPLTRLLLTPEQFATLNAEQKAAGNILLSADVYGTAADPRYCAVWAPNPGRVAWNTEALFDDGATLQQRFNALTSAGARPALIGVGEGGRHFQMFVDSRTTAWSSRVGMNREKFDTTRAKLADQGLFAVAISAAGSGTDARYAAIFQRDTDIVPRAFRSDGPVTDAAIDVGVEQYMRAHNLRGAALAVVDGTRLIYAKGYTLAEPEGHYPSVRPTTPFRLASVSKTFCAVAVWRLIQEGRLSLDTKMQDVLDLKPFKGDPPKHVTFGSIADVTVRHLLESISSINQSGMWFCIEAAQAAGIALPASPDTLARYIAGMDLTGKPGDTNNAVYGNTDYFLLSRIVAKKQNRATFEEALSDLVLKPLGMKHTRGSRSHVGDQPVDEARHHMTVHDPYDEARGNWDLKHLETGPSVRTPTRPLVPTHHGAVDWEAFDGCGGLSSSAVDVARLYAHFACRSGNPVLDDDTLLDMFDEAVDATTTHRATTKTDEHGNKTLVGCHGYHGFDGVGHVDRAKRITSIGKGGWMPGMGSNAFGSTNGLFWVLLQNGNSVHGVTADWFAPVQAAVAAARTSGQSWTKGDLFTSHFGLAALSAVQPKAPQKKSQVPPPSPRVAPALTGAAPSETIRRHMERSFLIRGSSVRR